jgi:hypothetical protein
MSHFLSFQATGYVYFSLEPEPFDPDPAPPWSRCREQPCFGPTRVCLRHGFSNCRFYPSVFSYPFNVSASLGTARCTRDFSARAGSPHGFDDLSSLLRDVPFALWTAKAKFGTSDANRIHTRSWRIFAFDLRKAERRRN